MEDFEPTYSPDGRYIAFTRFGRRGQGADIWIMRQDGSGARNITAQSPGFDLAATWAPR